MTELHVKVVPDSDEFRVEIGYMPKIYLEEEAENGRANQELVHKLESILGEKPGIISGHKSRRKKLKIPLEEEEVRQKFEEIE